MRLTRHAENATTAMLRELAVCSSNLHRGDQFFVDPQRMLVAAR